MKIQVLSDIHLEFAEFDPPETDAEVVILAGDVDNGEHGVYWAMEKFPSKPVLYVLGNHEYYEHAIPELIEQARAAANDSNVYFLENRSVAIDGVEFFGCTLWSDFKLWGNPEEARAEAADRMSDYDHIKVSPKLRPLQPKHLASHHRKSKKWLRAALQESQAKAKVVITHHAPCSVSLPEDFREDVLSAAYASKLDHFIKRSKAALWIHGHIHRVQDYMVGKTRVLSNPRGYHPEAPTPGFEPALVVEI